MLNAACRGWVGSFVLVVITCTDRANPTVTKADWDSSNAVLWTRADVLLAGLAIKNPSKKPKNNHLTKPTKNVFFFVKIVRYGKRLISKSDYNLKSGCT
jgi:hypothetical protein